MKLRSSSMLAVCDEKETRRVRRRGHPCRMNREGKGSRGEGNNPEQRTSTSNSGAFRFPLAGGLLWNESEYSLSKWRNHRATARIHFSVMRGRSLRDQSKFLRYDFPRPGFLRCEFLWPSSNLRRASCTLDMWPTTASCRRRGEAFFRPSEEEEGSEPSKGAET